MAIVLGFIGAWLAKVVTPPDIFAVTGIYFVLVAATAFGLLGFITPEIIELAGKAGITALALQIVKHLPSAPTRGLTVPSFPFAKRRKNTKNKYLNPLIIDTSALIDGRLADIVGTGFIFGTFLVIPSVIAELQQLADSANNLRRARGRRGLTVLETIKANHDVKLEILETEPEGKTVDDKIIKLAKKIRGKIITCDYNLNKVAKVKAVTTLNVNELTNAVKTAVLPSERLKIKVVTLGKARDQGVGYLEDGTMVVVEQGASLLGSTSEVVVLRVLQTAAGKMIFTRPAN